MYPVLNVLLANKGFNSKMEFANVPKLDSISMLRGFAMTVLSRFLIVPNVLLKKHALNVKKEYTEFYLMGNVNAKVGISPMMLMSVSNAVSLDALNAKI